MHVVEYLLSVGANPDTRNNNGKLAAELTQNADVRKLLKFGECNDFFIFNL